MKLLKIFVFICLSASCDDILAQPGSMTETEVKEQGKMIDASWAFVATQYDKAEKLYKEILDKNPKNAAVYYELARTYCALKQYDKAMQNAKQASDLEKTNTWYKQLLGEIFQNDGKFKEAAALYEALTKIEPLNEVFYFEWAECLALSGEKTKAIKAFDLLEKRTGFDEDISRQKHVLYLELGDAKKAEKELAKMIENEPTNIDFYHLLAGFYKQIGEKAKEQDVYQRIINIAPADERANIALAAVSKNQGNNDVYFSQLKTLFQNKGISLDAKIKELIPYANKVAATNDVALANSAIDLVKILETIHPDEAKVTAIYGDFLYYSNKKQEALAQYQKTVKLNGAVFPVWEQILDIQAENQDNDALLKTTEAALDYFPNQATIYYYAGVGNYGKKNFAEATTAYEQAIMMSGKNNRVKVNALTGLAKTQLKQQKTDAAKATLAKAQPLGADASPMWLETSGDAAALSNDADTALSFWQKAKEKGAKSSNLDKKIIEKKYFD
jgi:tetratricopeptide (TPR) repeat protein